MKPFFEGLIELIKLPVLLVLAAIKFILSLLIQFRILVIAFTLIIIFIVFCSEK